MTGGVFTSYDMAVVRIIRYQSNLEFIDVIVEFLFNCFILFYCFVAMIEVRACFFLNLNNSSQLKRLNKKLFCR